MQQQHRQSSANQSASRNVGQTDKSTRVILSANNLPAESQVRLFKECVKVPALQQRNTAPNKRVAGTPHYLFTLCCHCNTFVVAVGSIGKEVEELEHRCMRAILQLWCRGERESDVAEHRSNETLHRNWATFYL